MGPPLGGTSALAALGAGLAAAVSARSRGLLRCEQEQAAPPLKQLVFLVRHGESEAQRRKLIGQAGDWSLTAEGQRQAQCLGAFHGEALRGAASSGRVVSSSQRRAVQTASAALEAAGLAPEAAAGAVRTCGGLRECHRGAFDGQSCADEAVLRRWREAWAPAPPAELGGRQHFRVSEGAETYAELQGRAEAALEELLAAPAGGAEGPLWVFSHSVTIRALLWRALGLPADLHPLSICNCSVTIIERSIQPPSGWRVVEMNDTSHMHAKAAVATAY